MKSENGICRSTVDATEGGGRGRKYALSLEASEL